MMGSKQARLWVVICAVCLTVQAMVLADWSDDFSDGEMGGQPGYFAPENPNWSNPLNIADNVVIRVDVPENRLRIIAENTYWPVCFAGMSVRENETDCKFDMSEIHYTLARGHSCDGGVWDPENGMMGTWIHCDFVLGWTAYNFEYQNNTGWISITSYSGVSWIGLKSKQTYNNGYPKSMLNPEYADLDPNIMDPNVDPNWFDDGSPYYDPNWGDPNYGGYGDWNDYRCAILHKDPQVPAWFCIQYDPTGTNRDANCPDDPNDPNCHWLRGACWTGSRSEWDGTWSLEVNVIQGMIGETVSDPLNDPDEWPFDINDPNHVDLYHHEDGYASVSAFSGGESITPDQETYVCDAAYDDIEAKSGSFRKALTVKPNKAEHGIITISPDNPREPSDPNLGWQEVGFASGTEVTLTAVANPDKSFNYWRIYDPNYPGDTSHSVDDSNNPLVIMMDSDQLIEAKFKCGSSDALFLLGVMLSALALGVVIRRVR